MAVPFAQTTRSLAADRGIASLVLLTVVSSLLVFWLVWAFSVHFSIYAVSEERGILLDNTITIHFSADAGEGIQRGQNAFVYLDGPPLSEPLVLAAEVISVEAVADGVEVEVAPDFRQIEAAPVDAGIMAAFSQPVPGYVRIETETISPASLVLRSAGLNADTAPLVSNH